MGTIGGIFDASLNLPASSGCCKHSLCTKPPPYTHTHTSGRHFEEVYLLFPAFLWFIQLFVAAAGISTGGLFTSRSSHLIVRARETWGGAAEGNGNVATLCSGGLQPAVFLPLSRRRYSGRSPRRRADSIVEREMPSGAPPPTLDLNRHELLGTTEGSRRRREERRRRPCGQAMHGSSGDS